ncbi:protein NRT1/ PTR FAMILY 1.2-like [Bidens hawaiensis]|uniref:protein NRT1/ PTR FAMILY 1.2-like n=1 Tax=Bidens hawaiensis TaxID=980011 RepID=UPI004048F560
MAFPMPFSGTKGPIFEYGTNFDMAFRLFHGKNGVVPLSEGRLQFSQKVKTEQVSQQFNPLAAKAATISLSGFGDYEQTKRISHVRVEDSSVKSLTSDLQMVITFIEDSTIVEVQGMILLWLTTVTRDAKPPPCDVRVPQSCSLPTPGQYTLLYSALAIMSIGRTTQNSCRPCSLAFGADQIDSKDNPKRERVLESFFGWYYSFAIVSVLIAFTAIVYIQDHHGWRVGFGIPVILMFISIILFVVAYPLYYKMKVEKSVFTSLCQVIAVAWKNRKNNLPDSVDGPWCNNKDAYVTKPTDNLRFLNKACILGKPEDMTNPIAKDPWTVCMVDQVEELKALIKVTPLWFSCIMLSVGMSQTTFPVLQAQGF